MHKLMQLLLDSLASFCVIRVNNVDCLAYEKMVSVVMKLQEMCLLWTGGCDKAGGLMFAGTAIRSTHILQIFTHLPYTHGGNSKSGINNNVLV